MGHYMTKEERIILQTLLDEKKPVSYIARKLGCCRQTVYNEIKRGQYLHNYGYYDKLRYSADKGQQIHDYNQTAKGRPLKIGNDHAFAAYIEHKIIVDRYSPAAALAAFPSTDVRLPERAATASDPIIFFPIASISSFTRLPIPVISAIFTAINAFPRKAAILPAVPLLSM